MRRMPGLIITALCCGTVATTLTAQDSAPSTAQADAACGACHACAQPTLAEPCLRKCARPGQRYNGAALARLAGQEIVMLDMLRGVEGSRDEFGPVPFDHAGHARMAEMTRGCVACHHYTPEGAEHPACRTCHELSPQRADIRKPSLKGAYHRQCLNCHREWSHETKCSVCHLPKGDTSGAATVAVQSKDDIIGLMHPPIPEPETLAYESRYGSNGGSGRTTVLFRHHDHIHRYGLQCVDCHHESNCNRCHEPAAERAAVPKTPKQHHRPCTSCHPTEDPDRCTYCHLAPRFSHDQIGWNLGPFHQKVPCRSCHVQVPFEKLSRDCNTCHRNWKPATFNHAITRQVLSDAHAQQDCEECHVNRDFTVPPTCDECHDEGEGIRFPERRPGPYVATAGSEAKP